MLTLPLKAAGQTNRGQRGNNDDRFAIDLDSHVFIVVDGMGTHEVAARAAELAVEMMPHLVRDGLAEHGQPQRAAQQALVQTNQAVLALARQQEPSQRVGRGGATAVLAFQAADQFFITWLGDCRAYHVSADKSQKLTEDHDVVTALLRNGTISPEQARRSPISNAVYRYLGCEEPMGPLDFITAHPRPGDQFILASDGLWSHAESVFASICRASPQPQQCADRLIQMAVDQQCVDNATCVVVAFDSAQIDPSWLTWNGGTVARLARSIRDEKLYSHLPVLADALEDAGCAEAALLEHCRGPGPHGPGCWAIDLLLAEHPI